MKDLAINQFTQGLNTDSWTLNTKDNVWSFANNLQIIKAGENEFIIQTADSNSQAFTVTSNHIPVAAKSYDGIAYIVFAEVDYTDPDNPIATGVAEIGSYPSPDYSQGDSGPITDDYRPFNNYYDESNKISVTSRTISDQTFIGTTYSINSVITGQLVWIGDSGVVSTVSLAGNGANFFSGFLERTNNTVLNFEFTTTANNPSFTLNTDPNGRGNWVLILDIPVYGEFSSPLFNATIQTVGQIELQPSYDGTVNVIFNDKIQEAFIINSRFVKNADCTFTIVDRQGDKDSNLYTASDFDSTLRLIQSSSVIASVVFNGVDSGGQLPAGNYRYYFKYSGADGNLTDVFEESSMVSVFHGNSISTTRGGADITDKKVNFILNNLDTDFTFLKVLVVYTAEGGITTAYSIDTNYSINAETFSFSHTGYEATTPIDIDELTNRFSPIESFQAMTQIHNRLVIGNIKEKSYDKELFETVAEQFQLKYQQKNLDYPRTVSTFKDSIAYSDTLLDGWVSGYYNPYNIYHRTGYFGGETYPFGIVFILPDGSLTKVFPVTGIDDVDSTAIYTGSPTYDVNGFDLSTLQNNKGIYRFPNKDVAGAEITNSIGSAIRINGIGFKLPNTPEYIAMKQQSIGCFFVRGERVPDMITQGLITPTLKILISSTGDWDHDNGTDWDESQMSDKMVIPIPLGYLEAYFKRTNEQALAGLFVTPIDAHIAPANIGGTPNEGFVDNLRFAFFNHDSWVDVPTMSSVFANNTNQLRILGDFDVNLTEIFTRDVTASITGNIGGVPSLFLGLGYNTYSDVYNDLEVNANWTVGFTGAINSNRFTGQLPRYAGNTKNLFLKTSEGGSGDFGWGVYLNYNNYIGLKFNTGSNKAFVKRILLDPLLNQVAPFYLADQNNIGASIPLSVADSRGVLGYHVNIYGIGGQKTKEQLQQIYQNIDNNSYTPISPRLSWNDLESQVVNDYYTTFGGDCFINLGFRKVFAGAPGDELVTETDNRKEEGVLIGFLSESKHNIALRNEEVADVTESSIYGSNRSFSPYITRSEDFVEFRAAKNKIQESKDYNQGHSRTNGDQFFFPFAQGVPFLQNVYDTRIQVSEVYVNNSFTNGYRNFSGLTFEDYPKDLGPITALVNLNNRLLMFQQHGVSIVPFNERTMLADDGNNPLVVGQGPILSSNPGTISTEIGLQHQGAITKSDNGVYFIDVSRRKFCYLDHNGLNILSDFNIRAELERVLPPYEKLSTHLLKNDIRVLWDKKINDILFIGYRAGAANPISFSYSYNEIFGKFTSLQSYQAMLGFNISDDLYTFPLIGDKSGWLHHVNTNNIYCNYYDVQHPFEFEIVVNKRSDVQKIFNNLKIISNQELPLTISYLTDNDYTNVAGTPIVQEIIDIHPNNIRFGNAEYKENHVYVTLPLNENAPELTGRPFSQLSGKALRDKYIKIRFTYQGSNKVLIQFIQTFFTYSYS